MALRTTTNISERLYSLDALRGFDMFWIMGAEEIFHALYRVTGSPFWGTISTELTHPDWNGFHFYDLIFPLFFLSPVLLPLILLVANWKKEKPGNKCCGVL